MLNGLFVYYFSQLKPSFKRMSWFFHPSTLLEFYACPCHWINWPVYVLNKWGTIATARLANLQDMCDTTIGGKRIKKLLLSRTSMSHCGWAPSFPQMVFIHVVFIKCIFHDSIYGQSFFAEQTVCSGLYLDILLGEDGMTAYFTQDGALHIGHITLDMLAKTWTELARGIMLCCERASIYVFMWRCTQTHKDTSEHGTGRQVPSRYQVLVFTISNFCTEERAW